MRIAVLVCAVVVVAVGACEPGVSKTNELCGKASVVYAKCALGSNASVQQRSDMEIQQNRWVRLCRAVYTGSEDGLYEAEKAIYAALVTDGSAAPAKAFECASKSTTCEQADACE